MRRLLRMIVLAGGAAILASRSCAYADAAIGEAAPGLQVTTFDHQRFDLAALRGNVVIVNFWASWCTPCRAEMPVLDAFYRNHHAQGLEMIAVSADRPGDRDDALAALHEVSYPGGMAADARSNGFGTPGALPITYVIDPHGIVRAVLTPDRTPVTAESLNAIVSPLLGDVVHRPAAKP